MGEFLTIGYCFPIVFWKFWGDKALMEGDKVMMGDPPTRENPGWCCQYVHFPSNLTADERQPWTNYENNGNEYFTIGAVVRSE